MSQDFSQNLDNISKLRDLSESLRNLSMKEEEMNISYEITNSSQQQNCVQKIKSLMNEIRKELKTPEELQSVVETFYE